MKTKIFAVANLVFFIATVVVNYLANALPLGGKSTGELSKMYETLFVPADFTFSIRGLIYLLLLGFIFLQLFDAFKKKPLGITDKVGEWFIVSSLANIGWIFARHYMQVRLSVIIMTILLISLIVIADRIEMGKKLGTRKEKLFVQTTFSVYLGWISVATIANVSVFLVQINWNMMGMTDVFRTVVVIIVAMLLGLTALYKDNNVPYALVLLRAFYGIYAKRVEADPIYAMNIIRALAICGAVLLVTIGWRFEKWLKH